MATRTRRKSAATAETSKRNAGAPTSVAAFGSVDDYLNLPYTVRVTLDPTGGYVAAVDELPGCVTQAESWAEAGEMARDAMRAWIAAALQDGRPVPAPGEAVAPARILVRVPRSLHRDLLRSAESEGVSLNQFIACELARAAERSTQA